MKTLIWAFCFSFPSILFGQSTAEITVIRENNYLAGFSSFTLFFNNKPKALIKNASYYTFQAETGNFSLSFDQNNKKRINGFLVNGDKKFYTVQLLPGFWSTSIMLTEVDSVFASLIIKNRNLSAISDENAMPKRNKSRFGLTFGAGVGFENINVAQAINGDDSSISFGGGFSIGAQYGIELAKIYDINFEINYALSELSPPLKNIDVTFSRLNLSVRPSYIFNAENFQSRIKLGAGLDYYNNPILDMNGTEIKYGSSIGFHFAGVYEYNFSNDWMYSMGLKYTNVSYPIKSGSFIDNRLNNGNRSGIDFLFTFSKLF